MSDQKRLTTDAGAPVVDNHNIMTSSPKSPPKVREESRGVYVAAVVVGLLLGVGGMVVGVVMFTRDQSYIPGVITGLVGSRILTWGAQKLGALSTARVHGSLLEPKPAEIQTQLATACKVVFHRDKGFVGALRPFYVYLNGRKVGSVSNGQTLEFTTNTNSNTITVTDAVGTVFKDVHHFEAAEGGLVTVHFNRKFR